MKIISIDKTVVHDVEDQDGNQYRRMSSHNWEQLFGESWESYYDCKEIEEEFQRSLKDPMDRLVKAHNELQKES